jgi:3-deoxy-D-manno-octulosonate 8-phosphate phosphatase (KDO 8-P phosphatase)
MVLHRSGELGLFACVQKVWNKKEACEKIIKQAGLKKEQVLFVGDDIIDIPGMKACGVSAAVADSSSEVLEQADFVTFRSGGQGAAREIISLVLKCQNRSLMEAFDF